MEKEKLSTKVRRLAMCLGMARVTALTLAVDEMLMAMVEPTPEEIEDVHRRREIESAIANSSLRIAERQGRVSFARSVKRRLDLARDPCPLCGTMLSRSARQDIVAMADKDRARCDELYAWHNDLQRILRRANQVSRWMRAHDRGDELMQSGGNPPKLSFK